MDKIANMLSSILNAQARHKSELFIPFSRINFDVAGVLKKQGYIGNVQKVKDDNKTMIELELIYDNGKPKISYAKRVSKPGRKIYKGYKNIGRVLNGLGFAVVSTSKGVMSDGEARAQKVGGEIICEIY